MKISVVTVAHNAASTIGATLDSVAAQDWPDVEHVIVDGASSDDTMAVVEARHGRPGAVVSEPDAGIYDAMNKGIQLATGDIVGYLNADDMFMAPDSLSRIGAALDASGADCAFADLVYVGRDETDRVIRYWRTGEFEPGSYRRGWMPAHPTLYVRRDRMLELGGFDLQFRIAADFDFCLRLLELGRASWVYVPEVIVAMRVGGTSNQSLGNIARSLRESYRACRKNELPVSPLYPVARILSRLPQFFRRPDDPGATAP